MRRFQKQFCLTSDTRVLDVGGSIFNWNLVPQPPRLTMLNIHFPELSNRMPCGWIIADARHLPFKDRAFDIVYSNSVIEHLSTFESQNQMAAECVRVGQQIYIQTPNRRFFVEPHLLTPFIHWLPLTWQRKLLRNFTIWGLIVRPSQARCEAFLEEVRLLDEKEMRRLFPKTEIWHERVFWLTKSLIAVKTI
jgi:SAM-dependent methyltransferase